MKSRHDAARDFAKIYDDQEQRTIAAVAFTYGAAWQANAKIDERLCSDESDDGVMHEPTRNDND